MHLSVLTAHWCLQKVLLDPVELELQMIREFLCVLRTELMICAITVSALNCSAISLVPKHSFKNKRCMGELLD